MDKLRYRIIGGARLQDTFLEGPVERLCARLLPLMDRLTALNLFIPKCPQLPSFNELEHLELHCSEILLPNCGHSKFAHNLLHGIADTMLCSCWQIAAL